MYSIGWECTKCNVCKEVCPVGAITLQGGRYSIAESCTGCGECARACPVGAINETEGNGDMNCEDVLDCLSQYFDGEIESSLSAKIKLHLEKCAYCRIIWNTFKKTIEFIRPYATASRVKVSDDIHSRLIYHLKKNLQES